MAAFSTNAQTLGYVEGPNAFTPDLIHLLMETQGGVTLDTIGPNPSRYLDLDFTVEAGAADEARDKTNAWLVKMVTGAANWKSETGNRVDFEGDNYGAEYHDITDTFAVTVHEEQDED